MDQALKPHLPDETAAERAALARLAGGSIGAALTLATGDGGTLAKEADKLIDHAQSPDLLALLTLGEKLYRTQDGLELFGEFLTSTLADRIRARAHAGAPGLERWVAVLNRLEQSFARATGLHLEPRQTILSAARDLSLVARNGAL